MLKTKEKLLAIAIAIILVLFFNYGINVFYKEPQKNNFCKEEIYENIPTTKTECEKIGGKWHYFGEAPEIINTEKNGWCDPAYTCNLNYHNAHDKYSRTFFILMVVLGALSIIIGALMRTESVGAGFMGGGILAIIYGFIKYWSVLQDTGRFILLGIILFALIWLGYKKLGPKRKPSYKHFSRYNN